MSTLATTIIHKKTGKKNLFFFLHDVKYQNTLTKITHTHKKIKTLTCVPDFYKFLFFVIFKTFCLVLKVYHVNKKKKKNNESIFGLKLFMFTYLKQFLCYIKSYDFMGVIYTQE